jgi:hypothetical protein
LSRFFWRQREASVNDTTPKVVEIALSKHYRFMYENFIIATQHAIYLLLEKNNGNVDVLYFDSPNLRYGSPNDEARGGHPLSQYGLGTYGLFEVHNSPLIQEQMLANRVHPSHTDSLFDDKRHFIACFKDVMAEIVCSSFAERTMTVAEVTTLVQEQLANLDN